MAKDLVQTRVSDSLSERIDNYQKDDHLNRSEAIRELLRTGLDEKEADEESGDAADASDGESDMVGVLERGYRTARNLGDIGSLLCVASLFAWIIVTFGPVPFTSATYAFTATLGIVGILGIVVSLVFTWAVEYARSSRGIEVNRYLRRYDLRRVVLT